MTSRRIKFGYVDITIVQNKIGILQKYTGGKTEMYTPTILVYGADKSFPMQYRGSLTLSNVSTFVKNISDNQGFGIDNHFGSVQSTPAYGSTQFNYPQVDYGLWAQTLRLDRSTYAQTILNDDKNAWVIAFMNPRCPECAKFAPHWNKLQMYSAIRDREVKFAFVDVTI